MLYGIIISVLVLLLFGVIFRKRVQDVCRIWLDGRKKPLLPSVPSPDWSDESLIAAAGQDGGTFMDVIKRQPEMYRRQAEQALSAKYQRRTVRVSMWVGVGTTIAGLLAVIAAIGVPLYQHHVQMQSELAALYQSIDMNTDIFVNNANNVRSFEASDTIANIPDAYIDYVIPDDLQQPLQQKLGMVNYTFLLYYINQTKSLNQIRNDLNSSLASEGAASAQYTNAKAVYLATVSYLSQDGWNQTKFNYIKDPDCLMYLLQRSIDSIPMGNFDKKFNSCSSDSLNRIFYQFGYLPPLTPSWMNPLLRDALNQRQPGLGNQTIQMDVGE